MAGSQPIVLDLPRECCSFVDENEAFDVQFLMGGRVVCFSYGKEAFTTFWIVVDGFYGTKKIVITEVNKIDDLVLLLTMDSYLLRTFDGNHSIQIVQLGDLPNECRTRNLIEKTRGSVQRVSIHNDQVIIVLSVYESRPDDVLVRSTEFLQFKIGEWDAPFNAFVLKEEHFNHVDFVGCSTTGSLCFFASQGRIFHISDFETLIEVTPENSKVSRWQTEGLSNIFGHNIEHLAKNMSGAFYKDHFYLYLTPNPAVVKLEHYFLCLSLETRQWRRIFLNGPQFVDIIEVHMAVGVDGCMIIDSRNANDERNIHRVPLDNPESLLHLSQFAVNRRFGNLAEMTEEERQSKGLPLRLCIHPAFEYTNVTKYSLSTKESKIVLYSPSVIQMKEAWKNPALYKTRLCDNWSSGRPCKYGLNCWYAHGPRELRSVPHLESNPIAKSLSLAEVLEILPPSRTRDNAVHQANNMMNDASMDFFKRFTVPALNAIVSNLAGGGQQAPNQSDPSFGQLSNLMPLLMQAFGDDVSKLPQQYSNTSPQSPSQDSGLRRPIKISRPSANTHSANSYASSSDGPSLMRNSTSSFDSLPNAFSVWSPPNSSLENEDTDEKTMFDSIHQRYEGYCDNFFV